MKANIIDVTVDDDGTIKTLTIQTDNRDMLAWERYRVVKKLPSMSDAPMTWMTFMAWSAMRRAGDTDVKIDAFFETCLRVEPHKEDPDDEDDDGTVEVDPTSRETATDW